MGTPFSFLVPLSLLAEYISLSTEPPTLSPTPSSRLRLRLLPRAL